MAASTESASSMKTILVVEDVAICREPLAEVLTARGYRVLTSENGREGLDVLQRENVDLAIIDLKMPVLDGLGMLDILNNHPRLRHIPVLILTNDATRDSIHRAAGQGVRGYVLKSNFSLADLLARIEKAIGRSEVSDVAATGGDPVAVAEIAEEDRTSTSSSAGAKEAARSGSSVAVIETPPAGAAVRPPAPGNRQETLKRLNDLSQMKTLAGSAAEIVALAASPRSDRADLASVINRDPILATKVLRVANSAAYAKTKSRICNIEGAVAAIGFAAVRNVATTVGVFDAVHNNGKSAADSIRCWQHSLAAARIMEVLIPPTRPECAVAYLVGLCLDFGEIILRQYFAEEYKSALEQSAARNVSIQLVEREMFGIDQDELAHTMLTRLGIPSPIADPIRAYAEQREQPLKSDASYLVAALRIADSYSNGLLLVSNLSARVEPLPQADFMKRDFTTTFADVDPVVLRSQAVSSTNMLAQLSSSDEAVVSRPLIQNSGVEICYLRHSSLQPLDPFGVALRHLASITLIPSLKQGAEPLSTCKGLVVSCPNPTTADYMPADIRKWLDELNQPDLPVYYFSSDQAPTVESALPGMTLANYPISLQKLASLIPSRTE